MNTDPEPTEQPTPITPKSSSFADVNHYVHMEDAGYEELQNLCLGLAAELEAVKKQGFTLGEWSEDLQPDEPGQYLFYGDRFGAGDRPSRVQFSILTVRMNAGGNPMRTLDGNFLFDFKPSGKVAKINKVEGLSDEQRIS